jgi:acyl carrier protein
MELKASIRNFISNDLLFTPGEFAYDDDDSFLSHGIIDSLGVMELVAFVNGTFAISVAPEDVTPANFDSVDKLAAFVSSRTTHIIPEANARPEKLAA